MAEPTIEELIAIAGPPPAGGGSIEPSIDDLIAIAGPPTPQATQYANPSDKFKADIAGGFGNILNGISFNQADEIIGSGAGAIDYVKENFPKGLSMLGDAISGKARLVDAENPKTLADYIAPRMAQSEQLRNDFKINNPVTGYGGEIAGALVNPLNGVKVLKDASLVGRVAESGLNAAAQGGLFGLGENQDRIANAEKGIALGGVLGAGGELLASGVSKAGDIASDIGSRLQLGAIGVTKSDAKRALLSGKDLTQAVDDIRATGGFKDGFDPESILSSISGQVKQRGQAVSGLISEADNVAPKNILPDLSRTEGFLSKLKGKEFEDASKYATEEISALRKTLDDGGTLLDWQKAKQALQGASKYGTETSPLRNEVRKQIASDLRQHVEDGVEAVIPGGGKVVKQSNKEIGDRLSISKILERTQAGESVQNPVNSLRDVLKTTGGFGVPIIVGGGEYARSGDPKQALIAAIGGAALTSRSGQFKLGSLSRGLGSTLSGSSIPAGLIGLGANEIPLSGLSSSSSPQQSSPLDTALSQLSTETQSQPGGIMAPKSDDVNLDTLPTKKPERVAYVESLIDSDPVDAAIYEMESSRNPEAKNLESSASGAFQLLKKTAANLGVDNVFDIADNYKGYLKLKEENQGVLERLGLDPNDGENLYSLHYLGAPVFRKLSRGLILTKDEQAQVKYLRNNVLPKFRKIYDKTSKDVLEV